MRKRWMAALLCGCMIAGALTGCGSSKSTDEKEKTDTASAQAEDTGDGTEKLSIFINMSWYPQDSFTGKIPDKIKEEVGWYPETCFEDGIRLTIQWFFEHEDWMKNVTSGDYQKYYEEMYKTK